MPKHQDQWVLNLKGREDRLRSLLGKRAGKPAVPVEADWKTLLVTAITEAGGRVNEKRKRHLDALEEQSDALKRLMSRRMSILVGRAGTGKTSAWVP